MRSLPNADWQIDWWKVAGNEALLLAQGRQQGGAQAAVAGSTALVKLAMLVLQTAHC